MRPLKKSYNLVLSVSLACLLGFPIRVFASQDGASDPEKTERKHLDVPPKAIKQVRAKYPYEMRRAGIGGTVIVEMIIETDGRVLEAYVVKTPHEGFVSSCVDAAKKWKFTPGMHNGQLVRVRIRQEFNFEAEKAK